MDDWTCKWSLPRRSQMTALVKTLVASLVKVYGLWPHFSIDQSLALQTIIFNINISCEDISGGQGGGSGGLWRSVRMSRWSLTRWPPHLSTSICIVSDHFSCGIFFTRSMSLLWNLFQICQGAPLRVMPAFLHGFQCVWDQVWLSMGSAHQSRNDYQYFKLINLWEYLNPFTVLQSPSLLSRRKNSSNHFTFQAFSK